MVLEYDFGEYEVSDEVWNDDLYHYIVVDTMRTVFPDRRISIKERDLLKSFVASLLKYHYEELEDFIKPYEDDLKEERKEEAYFAIDPIGAREYYED